MSRSPSVPLAGYDEMSSPDPLTTSVNSEPRIESSPSKRTTRGTSRGRSSKTSSHVGKASAELQLTPQSSPVKTVTEQTLSPWKIRVTVEAEPEDGNDNVQTYTRTMKIPLREESSPSAPRPAAGRCSGRLSQPQAKSKAASPSRSRQRSATPVDGRRRRQSVTDLDIVVLGDDSDEAEWGKKKRKSSPKKSKSKKNSNIDSGEGQRRSSAREFDIRQDTSVQEDEHNDLAIHSDSPELRQIDLNRVSVRPRTNSTKQKVLPSIDAESPMPTTENTCLDTDRREPGVRDVSTNSLRSYPTPSPTPSDQGFEHQNQEAGVHGHGHGHDSTAQDEHHEGFDTIMESEGFTMIDLDTIPSARYLKSSPSDVTYPVLSNDTGDVTQQPVLEEAQNGDILRPTPAKAFPSYLILAEGESEISSRIPSSPPLSQPLSKSAIASRQTSSHLQLPSSVLRLQQRKVTPAPYSSPRLPSPPRPVPTRLRANPQSNEVLRVGMALQGALQPQEFPEVQNSKIQSLATPNEKPVSHARSSSDELFEGFDSSTQREMRAGLRFGEELAKRQQPARVLLGAPEAYKHTSTERPVWRGEHVVQHTPILSPIQHSSRTLEITQDSESRPLTKSAQIEMVKPLTAPPHTRRSGKSSESDMDDLNSSARREEMWQRERNNVVKEAQEADPSKVITIDSDEGYKTGEVGPDEDAHTNLYEDDADIWLVEAKDSSSSPRLEPGSSPLESQRGKRREEGYDVPEQPRRSLIPSPWKRGEQADNMVNESTVLTTGEGESAISGLFWKHPNDVEDLRFGAKQLKNVRKELRNSDPHFRDRTASGSFNLEMMIGTPKRIRESLEREQTQKDSKHLIESKHHESVDDDEEMDVTVETDGGSSPITPQAVPVKFNDSTLSQMATLPLRPTTPILESAYHPPTPRSAMKGRRQSVGTGSSNSSSDTTDQAQRRVSFARRSNHVDEDGIESSRSMEDEDVTPMAPESVFEEQEVQSDVTPDTDLEQSHSSKDSMEKPENIQKNWFGWFGMSKSSEDQNGSSKMSPANEPAIPQHDGLDERLSAATDLGSEIETNQEQEVWAPTSKSEPLSSSPIATDHQDPTVHQQSRPRSKSTVKSHPDIPSYLLPPSYPSDPTLKHPLTASGKFTNSHFRTLHIIYRKALRPRFHAPSASTLRPEIARLVQQKWTLDVDESATADLGTFAFSIHEQEGRVLERFCREVEFGIFIGSHDNNTPKEIEKKVSRLSSTDPNDHEDENGIWSGKRPHGSGEVKWEWSCEQLATWLARIAIGEVVRKEEFR